ncbi:MAG: DUF2520 domain-containing protein [Bacteroidota bacterium]|nr:DUF2520 domain-containing protein [Bacteroidota bacterium]
MKITLLGNGKMANMLVQKLLQKSVNIELWGRDIQKVKSLFGSLPIQIIENLEVAGLESDVIILAVADSAIEEVANKLGNRDCLVIHTSGATSMDVLYKFKNSGVWWPPASVQMITADISEFAACVEANSKDNLQSIISFSEMIGIQNIFECDSFKRLQMHTAAVFANNFTTYIILRLREYCELHNIPIDIYKPMLKQAMGTFFENNPNNLTGPASRGDKLTLKKHIETLETETEMKNIYAFLTNSILAYKNFDFKIKDL